MTAILNGQDVANHHTVRAAADEVGSTTQLLKDLGIQAAELAGSSVPGVGAALDAKSFYENYQAGSWGGMLVDAIGVAPVIGDGAKGLLRGSRISWQTAKAVKRLSEARSKLDIARKQEASRLYSKAQKQSPYENYKEAFDKCNSEECRRKAKEQYKKDRYKRLPSDKQGTWAGTKGNSKFIPHEGSALDKALKSKYPGQDGIQYRDGYPDFSPFSKKEVNIPNMGGDLHKGTGNLSDEAQTRAILRETNPGGWSKAEEAGYVWHHKQDGSTMMLVDKDIHNTTQGGVAHVGGASMVQDPDY